MRKTVVVDSFNRDATRRKIYEIYDRKEHVTVSKLLISFV